MSDTVHVVAALLPRVEGAHDTDVSWAGALAASVKPSELPFRLAVRSADVLTLSAPTVAVNEPAVFVAPILMLAGTVMPELLLDRAMVNPPDGAGADKVTVQAELPGALTVPGEQFRLPGTTRVVRLTVAIWFWPFSVAVIVAVWLLLTVPVVAVKVALLWPPGTVTLAGTGRVMALLASAIVAGLEAA